MTAESFRFVVGSLALWLALNSVCNVKALSQIDPLPRRVHSQPIDRRSWCLQQHVKLSTPFLAFLMFPPSNSLAPSARAASQARVKKQPGLEYLEPIYELQLSIQALRQGLDDRSKWPNIKARLDKFFGGGLLSERNFYGGLNVQYMNQIDYDTDGELKEYIRLDREERFGAMEDALNALESVKTALSQRSSNEKDVMDAMDDATASINRWFTLVPEVDRKAVAELYASARKVDANRDGRLDSDELGGMDENSRELWKRRIKVAGG